MSIKTHYIILLFLLIVLLHFTTSSEGDRSPFYQKCLKTCNKANCTKGEDYQPNTVHLQDEWSKRLFWSCKDDCRYNCMWRTVQGFTERGYRIPKFHGKWPFKRILGIQEPASMFASLLNLYSHIYMYLKIRKEFKLKESPLVLFWHVFAMVCINAWNLSVVFHTRDTYFTEFLDYAGALSMVMSLFVAAIVRILNQRRKLSAVILFLTLVYYVEHVRYLYSGRIDYDYNMRVNIFFGAAGGVLWLWWAAAQMARGRRYAWRLGAFALLSGAALALELLDFPPRLGWDAHALWHLSTAPLATLFYAFVIDDLKYLRTTLPSKKSDLKTT